MYKFDLSKIIKSLSNSSKYSKDIKKKFNINYVDYANIKPYYLLVTFGI